MDSWGGGGVGSYANEGAITMGFLKYHFSMASLKVTQGKQIIQTVPWLKFGMGLICGMVGCC